MEKCCTCKFFVKKVNPQLLQEQGHNLMAGVSYAPVNSPSESGVCYRYPQEIKKRGFDFCGEWSDDE